ncbi:MAG: hypothetical protein ACRCWF_06050 [Beijerinckiaceae bacterium]
MPPAIDTSSVTALYDRKIADTNAQLNAASTVGDKAADFAINDFNKQQMVQAQQVASR